MGGGHNTKPVITNLLLSVVLVIGSSVYNTGVSWSVQKNVFCVLCGLLPYKTQQA